MVKIKIFTDFLECCLEKQVNDWLASHRSSDIINIQYTLAGAHAGTYSVCITYRDGS